MAVIGELTVPNVGYGSQIRKMRFDFFVALKLPGLIQGINKPIKER